MTREGGARRRAEPRARAKRFTTRRSHAAPRVHGSPAHRALVERACEVASHVLSLFERERPQDVRPREALQTARAWAKGRAPFAKVRKAAVAAHAAARAAKSPAAKAAARACGHAAATAHSLKHAIAAGVYYARAKAAER